MATEYNNDKNLLSTIVDCLEEHTVNIDGTDFYLIEGSTSQPLVEDFIDTYIQELDSFKIDLARKLISDQHEYQTYGALIDMDLQYIFAFNREFADIEDNKLVFKDPEEILSGLTEGRDLSEIVAPPPETEEEVSVSITENMGTDYDDDDDIMNIQLKYATIGRKEQ